VLSAINQGYMHNQLTMPPSLSQMKCSTF